MLRSAFALPLVALILAASPSAADARRFAGLALAPAGDRIADIETADATPDHGAIVLRGIDGRIQRTIDPCAACSYSGLAWSGDGTLAFLARNRAAGTVTLSIVEAKGVRTLATIAGIAQTPRFSHDGRRIALLVTLAANKESGATQAGVRQIGEIGEANDEQRLAIFDITRTVAAKDVAPLSPAGRYVYEYDWMPDGSGVVATTALGNGDANWWVATLDAIDAQTGTVRPIAKLTTQANYPRVSPDGRTVAYIGGLMSDFGSVGGDIWTVPVAGGTPENRTPGYKASVTSLDWTAGGIRATTLAGADQNVIAFDPAKGASVLWSRPASLGAGDGRASYSADGRVAASVVQDFEHAPEIHAGPIGTLPAVTRDNAATAPIVASRSITWRNGGMDAQGWLLTPRGLAPGVKLPMVVDVHGGPAAAHVPGFVAPGGGLGDLIGAGYAVFLPNPRGSYGQGEAFTAANRRDFGGGDLKDILAGIDAVEKVAPIDDARLGLMGGSYGGFMAMWANTQTNRFKAILAAAGLSDWISYYGTNGIDQWMIPYFGKSMYADPDIYRKLSPITYVTQAKTPTLITVGERDIEVPPTQSIEWWHGLKAMGVPTTLVIYPDEGHGIRGAANAADVRRRSLEWLARYLGPARP